MYLEISQNSQENTCAGVSFLIKLQAQASNFNKKDTLAQVFSCKFCEISKNTYFTKHLRTTASIRKLVDGFYCVEFSIWYLRRHINFKFSNYCLTKNRQNFLTLSRPWRFVTRTRKLKPGAWLFWISWFKVVKSSWLYEIVKVSLFCQKGEMK